MKRNLIVTFVFLVLTSFMTSAQAGLNSISLQVHNPTGAGNPESSPKSQFVMKNESDPGINVNSILWTFANPIFIDSTGSAPGFGGFANYSVSPAQTYDTINVGANSDVTVGYTGPTNLTNGATSLLLTFNDFNPLESFAFWTDLDTSNNSTGRLGNSDFNGSKTKITFSSGYEYEYTWNLPDNSGRSFYAYNVGGDVPSTHTPEPATMLMLGSGLLGGLLRKKFFSA